MGPNSLSITRFDCHAAVCLPDGSLEMFVKSRSVWYSLDWSGAEHYGYCCQVNGESVSLPVFAYWANTSSNFTAGS